MRPIHSGTHFTMNTSAYSDGYLHLGAEGYEIYASRLKPVVQKLMQP